MSSTLLPSFGAARLRARFTTVGALVVGLVILSGCKKSEAKSEAPAPVVSQAPPTPTPPAPTFAVGDKVDVKWNSSWWKGEILAVNGDKYRVHYVGWSSSWDEEVTPDRVRAQTEGSSTGTEVAAASASAPTAAARPAPSPTGASAAKPATTWKVGDKVDVNWNGQWWQGQILSANGSQYKVHYIGWASSWDEVVGANRLRAPTSGAKRGSGS